MFTTRKHRRPQNLRQSDKARAHYCELTYKNYLLFVFISAAISFHSFNIAKHTDLHFHFARHWNSLPASDTNRTVVLCACVTSKVCYRSVRPRLVHSYSPFFMLGYHPDYQRPSRLRLVRILYFINFANDCSILTFCLKAINRPVSKPSVEWPWPYEVNEWVIQITTANCVVTEHNFVSYVIT